MTDRLNLAKPKSGHPRGDLCSGFEFIYDKGLGPRGRFYGPGSRKMQKTKKLRKRSEVKEAAGARARRRSSLREGRCTGHRDIMQSACSQSFHGLFSFLFCVVWFCCILHFLRVVLYFLRVFLYLFAKKTFLLRFSSPRAVKQEKTSQRSPRNQKSILFLWKTTWALAFEASHPP